MKHTVIAELPHAKLVKFSNQKYRLYVYGTDEARQGYTYRTRTVSLQEVKDRTLPTGIDLQSLVSGVKRLIGKKTPLDLTKQ